jgi:hypothetical protein
MKRYLLLLLLLACSVFKSFSQCATGQDYIVVQIIPDSYPTETSWTLTDINGTVFLNGIANSDSICVPSGSCLRFRIEDTFGDGICCGYGQGSYTVFVNGAVAVTGGQFAYFEERFISCPPGTNCDNSFTAYTDTVYQSAGRSTWYSFVPDSTGTYNISTCFPSNSCNTALWVYDLCAGLQFDTTNIGSLFYNDSACGDQAFIAAGLQAGVTYYIRVGGDYSCVDSSITWQVTYGGPVVGCTDPAACNFNPLATVSNGNCIYPGDPNCSSGPDLVIDQGDLQSSISTGTVNGNDACLIGEGCLAGYGVRNVINFSTTIRNIGDADYYIGPPQTGNSQFVFDQCHGHWHYAGYASYELYDSLQHPMQVGFKNGFCVLDLSCFGGTAKYGCSNMGISAGCADTYGSGLSCQWIDITDVPSGRYTLVVKVNWDQSPDKLGRVEQRFDNNVGYVCLQINRNAQNVPSVTILPTCVPIVDCVGDTFGLAQEDCNGVCNGSRLHGDLNMDTLQTVADVNMYISDIINNAAVVTCNDLNDDALLTVADAALLNGCIRNSNGAHTHPGGTQNTHRHCQFPFDILNITDTVNLGFGAVNTAARYVNIQMKNADCSLLAMEFTMSGLQIDSVVSLVNGFNPLISFNTITGHVVVIDTAEVLVGKQLLATDVLRVYYSSITAPVVCISSIQETVNGDYERTLHQLFNGCVTISGLNVVYNSQLVKVTPNPSSGIFNVSAEALRGSDTELTVTDVVGRKVYTAENAFLKSSQLSLDLSDQPKGVYLIRIKTNGQIITNRIVKM